MGQVSLNGSWSNQPGAMASWGCGLPLSAGMEAALSLQISSPKKEDAAQLHPETPLCSPMLSGTGHFIQIMF